MDLREDFRKLARVLTDLAGDLSMDKLLSKILEAAAELTGAERGFLVLADGDMWEHAASLGFEAGGPLGPEGQSCRELVRRAMSQNEVLVQVVEDRTPIGVPLVFHGQRLGGIYLDRPGANGESEAENLLDLLAAYGATAAMAVVNARLVEGYKKKTTRLVDAKRQVEVLNQRLKQKVALTTRKLVRYREKLKEKQKVLEERFGFRNIIGVSFRMEEVFGLLEKAAASDFPLLIRGESGTGKELAAMAVHYNGPRRRQRYLPINCASLTEALLESELFGHVKGAFTGADRDKPGLFMLADRGSIFLDEIGEMSPELQARLLRVLEDRKVRPLGTGEEREVNVRIIAATHRDLEAMVDEGRFRQDLYYRLRVLTVDLPPLRDRREDIPLLVDHFLETGSAIAHVERKSITAQAINVLTDYHWPGNIRELSNEIKRLIALAGDPVTAEDVAHLAEATERIREVEPGPVARTADGSFRKLEDLEREHILAVFEAAGRKPGEAANLLGINYTTLWRRLKKYGVAE